MEKKHSHLWTEGCSFDHSYNVLKNFLFNRKSALVATVYIAEH